MPRNEIDCSTVKLLIEPYVDNELGQVMRDAVGSHIARCPVCTAYLGQLNELHAAVRAWPRLGEADLALLDQARVDLQASQVWRSLTPAKNKAMARQRRFARLGPRPQRPGPLMVLSEARRVRRSISRGPAPTAATPEPGAPTSRPTLGGRLRPAAGVALRRATVAWTVAQTVTGNTARLGRRIAGSLSRYRGEAISMG